jgi:hypothetical protein
LVVAGGELVGDALAHGVGGGAGVAAESFQLGDEPVLGGLVLADLPAEVFGAGKVALVVLVGGGGQDGGEHVRAVGGQQPGDDLVDGVVDDALTEGGADVAGVLELVAGAAGVVGAGVVVVLLAGAASGVGLAGHPPVALGAADPGAQRVVRPPVPALVLVVLNVAALPAGHLGGFPQLHADQGGVLVAVGGPGPVLARHCPDFPPAGVLAVAGVAGPANNHAPGVLGVGQDAVHRADGPRPAVPGRRALPLQPLGDGGQRQLLVHPPLVDAGDPGAALGVGDEPGAGRPHGRLHRVGVGGAVFVVAVGGGAGVVAADGVLLEAFPHLGFEVVAEVLGHALLHPADQDGGRLGGGGVDRLVGGEDHQPGGVQLLLELERVVGVAAGPLDVLADHPREPGRPGSDLGAEVGHAAVAGDAGGGELPPRPGLAALVEVGPAGLHVPVVAGDDESLGEPLPRQAELLGQRLDGVLHLHGGGPADERHRHDAYGCRPWLRCCRDHCSSSLIASAWAASSVPAARRLDIRIFARTLIPPGLSPSLKL